MSLLGEIGYALITTNTRAIGTLIPDVTITENHRDGLIITQHPVEGGGIISDHAFKRPAELEMTCGWSDSTVGFAGYTRQVYEMLQRLQAARQPFNISTGKRRYKNMLLRDLSVTTEVHSENILLVSASFQEVILVSTQTTSTGGDTPGAGDSKDAQSNPQSTDNTSSGGSQQGSPVGSTDFAGNFNPGNTDYGQGSPPGPFDNVGGLENGLAPPTPGAEVTLPEISVSPGTGTGTGSQEPGYNIWEFG